MFFRGKNLRSLKILFLCLLAFNPLEHYAQEDSLMLRKKWHQSGVIRASAAPVVLIGYGFSTIGHRGIYSSFDAHWDINRAFPVFHTRIDDYLVYSPYVALLALNLMKIPCRNDFINTGLLIAKSQLLMVAMVYPLKRIVRVERPDGADFHSFPSGHTAGAFVAASIFHKEFGHRSIWYSIGAYTVASGVAMLRMMNNEHWKSDVIAGAGFGILAVNLAYLTHRYKWGRKQLIIDN